MSKAFYYLWGTISFSKLASAFYLMMMTLLIYNTTLSATLSSLIMLVYIAGKLSASFYLPILNQKKSIHALLLRGLLLQIFMILGCIVLSFYLEHFPLLYIFLYGAGFSDGIIAPTRNALIPVAVEKHQLEKANSFISTTDQTLSLIGWAFGAVLYNVLGDTLVFTLILALLFMALLLSTNISVKLTTLPITKNKQALKKGWQLLFDKKYRLHLITTMGILEGIAASIWIGGITLIFVQTELHQTTDCWGFINAGHFAGSILGGILIALNTHRLSTRLLLSLLLGSFIVSLLVLLYALNTSPYLALLLVVVMGPFYQLRDISQQTYIQKTISHTDLLSLYAAKDNLYYATFALSVFLSGFISDTIGVVYVYYGAFFL